MAPVRRAGGHFRFDTMRDMAPSLGQVAPSIHARSDNGTLIDLAALRGRWVVLYFYPRANTPGCTIEAQSFEQALPEFERLGAEVIGVSTDTEARQASFRHQCSLSFPLLPDSNREICRAYGVLGGLTGLLGVAARQTFLINPEGQIAYIWKSVNPTRHAAEVLERLGKLQSARA